jgi:hypothetical protein
MDPHHFGKSNPDSGTASSEKQDPDPHQSELCWLMDARNEGMEAQNGAVKGL